MVFMVGCGFGTEKFTLGSLGNMLIVGVGIAIASYGTCVAWHRPPCMWGD